MPRTQAHRDRDLAEGRIEELRAVVRDLITALQNRNEALTRSVKLQSHYANLLNMHDGGKRLQFADAAAWIARLEQLRTDGALQNKSTEALDPDAK